VALAGCLAGGPQESGADPGATKLPPSEVKATAPVDQPARVEGVVKDPDGVAVAEVRLRLDGGDTVRLEAASDAEGRFVFAGLPNGTYALTAEKTGYEPAQVPFVLQAGETKAVEVVLVLLEVEGIAKTETIELDGFIKCVSNNPIIGDELLERPCFLHSGQETTLEFEVGAAAKSVLAEVTWQKVQTSTSADLYVRLEVESLGGAWRELNDTQGGSPRRMRADEGAEAQAHSFYPLEQATQNLTWRVDVFAPTGNVPHTIVDQPFHVTVRVFYNITAPGDDVAWTAARPSGPSLRDLGGFRAPP
jgi:hypothetical protein